MSPSLSFSVFSAQSKRVFDADMVDGPGGVRSGSFGKRSLPAFVPSLVGSFRNDDPTLYLYKIRK